MNRALVLGLQSVALFILTVSQLNGQDLLIETDKLIKNFHIDSSNKIYVHTTEEVCMYEGAIKISDCQQIERNVDGLMTKGDNSVVLHKANSLFRYKDSKLYKTDTLPNYITASANSGDDIYVGTSDGLYLVKAKGDISVLPSTENLFINDIQTTVEHELFIATDNGLHIVDSSGRSKSILKQYSISQSVKLDSSTIVVLSDEGEIIFSSLANGNYEVTKSRIEDPINLLASQGQLYVHSKKGIFIWDGDYFKSVLSGKFDDFSVCFNVLFVSKQNQLLTYDLTSIITYTSGKNFCLYLDKEDHLWVGQNKRLIIYQPDGTQDTLNIKTEKKNLYISSIIVQKDKIYVGTMGEGLLILDKSGGIIKTYENKAKTNQNNVIQLRLNSQTLWVAYLNGVYLVDTETLSVIKDYSEMLGQNYLYSIFPVDYDHFYLGSSNSGLVKYQDEIKTYYLKDESIYSIAKTDNELFVSTERSGVYKIKNEEVEKIFEGIPVHALAVSEDHLIISEKNAVNIYDLNSSKVIPLDTDSLYNCQLNGISENRNHIVIAYENGILKIDKAQLPFFTNTQLHLNAPSQFNQQVPTSKSKYAHTENSISFSYHPTSYYNNNSSFYKYRLVGQDSNWITTQQSTVDFYNLNPGAYDFEVTLGYTKDFKPREFSNYAFVISSPFWETNWFRLLTLCCVIGLIYFIIKRREKVLLKAKEIEQERLFFELEQLKKQIDPHFLFNSFNSLIGLIEESPKLAAKATENLSNFYREVTTLKNNDLIELERDLQITNDYFSIQKLRFEDLISLNINVVNKMGKVIPLATQALIENAIKHNLINQQHRLDISITQEDEYLVVSNRINTIEKAGNRSGHGLNNLSKRYKLLTNKEVLIAKSDNYFTVKLPIIHD